MGRQRPFMPAFSCQNRNKLNKEFHTEGRDVQKTVLAGIHPYYGFHRIILKK